MNRWTVSAFMALALILPTAVVTNHDTEVDQTTADTVADREVEAALLHADMRFAEARP